MPRVSRRRVVAAPPSRVYELVADPYHLPRWWPGVSRVENVNRVRGDRRSQWTTVMETREGRVVRADYRCTSAANGERYAWEQQVGGTPFERVFAHVRAEIGLVAKDSGTEVTLSADERLRGLSRLGSPLMRRATRGRVDEALSGLEHAIGGVEEPK